MDNKTVKDLISSMTLEEKAGLLSGRDFWKTRNIDRLGVDSFMMCDGPNGLRKQEGKEDHLGINESIRTVCYPTSSAVAASFDPELAEELGKTLGRACRREHVSMLLGPGLNMKRSPLCGRNFEYYSEDPYQAGTMASAYVKGLQSMHVLACPKHFAGNNQEKKRMSGNSIIDERTLHEIYLSAFEMVVKNARPHAIMCSYNRVNGTFMPENKELLTDVLRKRWGFDGFVVTDWGAAKDPVKGIKAGLDLIMPGGSDIYRDQLISAVKSGDLEEEVIDRAAERLLTNLSWSKEAAPEPQSENKEAMEKAEYQMAKKVALNSAVLLKNEDHALPLKDSEKVVFIGEFAVHPRYQGSGSSHINSIHVADALESAKSQGHTVGCCQGYDLKDSSRNPALLTESVEAAKLADKAVIFAGLPDSYESEGFDRDSIAMPEEQNRLISEIAAVQPNTIVVLHNGAPVSMPWMHQVKAILEMYLAGDACGEAESELLYGAVNPSGKLAETFPLQTEDNPSFLNFPGEDGCPEYREGVFIGYRYYDKKNMQVLFPFGHGLSYTTFSYSNLRLDQTEIRDTDTVTASVDVTNTGDVPGKEVVQLYISDTESTPVRPVRELKGFRKVLLAPGETKTVTFTLDKRSFAYYEAKIHDFYVESGDFTVSVGSSSRDLRLSTDIHVESTEELPVHFTSNSTIGSILKTKKGQAVLGPMMAASMGSQDTSQVEALGDGADKMAQEMTMDLPLAAMSALGGVPAEQIQQILQALNQ